MRQLLGHEADLISALTAAERTALTSLLAKLEQALTGLLRDKSTAATPRQGEHGTQGVGPGARLSVVSEGSPADGHRGDGKPAYVTTNLLRLTPV